MNQSTSARLELIGITKAFPGVLANDHVDLKVGAGEIHALLGENGAGKSTLVKMIYGIMAPDAGSILWDGHEVTISNPRAARRLGIGMVFQHFSLFEALTVYENIALGFDGQLSRGALEAKIHEVMRRYDLNLDPQRIVATLSVGERQRIEIVRALLLEPRLLIMDEPTSVLTPQEVTHLFVTLRRLASDGCSILYISHKLHEIVALCERATVLRGGKVVGRCDPREETARSMGEMMIGSELRDLTKQRSPNKQATRFVVHELSREKRSDFGTSLTDISFSVDACEIFGIAGVAGNGQNELIQALSGENGTSASSALFLDDKAIGALGPMQRRGLGLCTLPEERNGHAAIGEFSLAENAALTARGRIRLTNAGLIDWPAAHRYAARVIEDYGVKAQGSRATAASLSGGNLQKFIMGREILQRPDVLVVSQPTWGVDAGAAAIIHQALIDLAASGSAVVVISQDLDELLKLCDRLSVINMGRLSAPRAVSDVTVEELGLLMGGIHGEAHSAQDDTNAAAA